MKKALWIIPKSVYPINDGARMANSALLKSVRPHFDLIDLVIFNESKNETVDFKDQYQKDFSPREIFFIERPKFNSKKEKYSFWLKQLLLKPYLPVSTSIFRTTEQIKKLSDILNTNSYDVIIIDGLHPFENLQKHLNLIPDTKIVYRSHNVEEELWTSSANQTKNPILKLFLKYQGLLMSRLESTLLKKAHATWSISEQDVVYFQNKHGLNNIYFTPIGMKFEPVTFINNESINLLFLGKLDWAPNKDGLEWFLKNIWPKTNNKNVKLHIVGSGNADWVKPLIEGNSNIVFHGFVKNLDDVLVNMDYSIIPIRFGSGTRIKVIESAAKGLAMISTDMGIQGSGLTKSDYISVNDENEWINKLNSLDKNDKHDLAKNAFNRLSELYSTESVARKAYRTLE